MSDGSAGQNVNPHFKHGTNQVNDRMQRITGKRIDNFISNFIGKIG